MDNIRHDDPLFFAGTVTQSDDGSVTLKVRREDGMEKSWAFPANKLRMYRALAGQLGVAIAFMLGEDV